MKKEVKETDLLKVFVNEMEERGITRDQLMCDINTELLAKVNNASKTNISLNELEKITDRCIAKEWLKHEAIGGDSKYKYLKLTSSGNGVIRSLQIKEEAKARRSSLKKLSDYIEEHKGLFTVLGCVITLAGLLITIYRLKS